MLGPFALLGIAVNAPLNPEGVFGALVTGMLLVRRGDTSVPSSDRKGAVYAVLIALVALYPAGRVGLLSDDFILVSQAQSFTLSTLVPLFTSAGGDGFFRPLGYLSFDLNALTGGWHWVSLGIHAANAGLVALLAARLGGSGLVAFLAGTLFALHGTHLEAAVWIAGRFDLLAVLFALGALLLFGRNTAGALACTLAALWSKEAAFVLPGLVSLLAWHEGKAQRTTLPYWTLTGAAFLYRWVLLGGIGGYTAESGGAAFFSLKLASTAKAVFVRVWTSLYFPLNWSKEPSLLTGLVAVAYIAALLWVAWRCRPAAALRVAFAGLILCILPPLHLLGGAADLSGGRLLYLPSVWFCLMLAFAVAGMERRVVIAAVLLAFHFAALRHDLPFWQRASDQVQAICESGAVNPPRAIDGVPALANGFSECASAANR